MADATLEDYSALVTEVMLGHSPILPKPEWGQDAAFLAFALDRLRKDNAELRTMIEVLLAGIAMGMELVKIDDEESTFVGVAADAYDMIKDDYPG